MQFLNSNLAKKLIGYQKLLSILPPIDNMYYIIHYIKQNCKYIFKKISINVFLRQFYTKFLLHKSEYFCILTEYLFILLFSFLPRAPLDSRACARAHTLHASAKNIYCRKTQKTVRNKPYFPSLFLQKSAHGRTFIYVLFLRRRDSQKCRKNSSKMHKRLLIGIKKH